MGQTIKQRLTAQPAGMTLIELMIAMLLLVISSLAATSLQIANIKHGSAAYNLNVAALLAESEIERLQDLAMDFDSLADESQSPRPLNMDGEPCAAGSPGCNYTLTTTLTPGFPTSRSYEVTVNVSWNGPDTTRSVTFDTIVSAISF